MVKFLMILMMGVYGLSNADEPNEKKVSLPDGLNNFAWELFKEIGTEEKNTVISPYSIASSLSFAASGAKGQTQQQINKTLHLYQDQNTINKTFGQWQNSLNTTLSQQDLQFVIANALWMQKDTNILPSFMKIAKENYKAIVRDVDFVGSSLIATQAMNKWVKEATQGKIQDLLQSGDVDASTRMVLLNAISMKALWQYPFNTEKNQAGSFFNENGQTVSATFMNETETLPFIQTDNWSLLQLPYRKPVNGPELVMTIVLPKDENGFYDMIQSLSLQQIQQKMYDVQMERVLVQIPKFKFTYRVGLKSALEALGMQEPFTTNADFSGINGLTNLSISKVLHEAFISVDESGTEAAAATSVNISLKSVLEEKKPIVFRADHPFLFLIYDKSNGLVLFIGKVVNL